MSYTVEAAVAVLLAALLDLAVLRTMLLTRRAFWTSYAIIGCFQLVVNAVLTGLPVVEYNRSAIVGLRIAYAPVEDLLFGFAMVTVTLSVWVWLGRRAARRQPAAGPPTREPSR